MNLPFFIARKYFWSKNKLSLKGLLISFLLIFVSLLLFCVLAILLYLILDTLEAFGIYKPWLKILYVIPAILCWVPIFFYSVRGNFINVITVISMIILSVCTASLIIVLSVFNGIEDLLHSMYNIFDPEIKIEATHGKSFEYTDALSDQIQSVAGVAIITEVIEDYAYVKYREGNMVVTIKGVSENFLEQNRINPIIVAGEAKLTENGISYAIIGRGIQYALSIQTNTDLYPLQIHYIKDVKSGTLDVNKLYSKKNILPSSVFAIEKNYDENYIFVPLSFAQNLLNYGKKRTSLEIMLKAGYSVASVKKELRKTLGDSFKVQDEQEQHADLYKLLNLEKLFLFIAFTFILAVGSINIFFALTMLAIDKKKDITVLYALGATNGLIRRIFLMEGAIISYLGAITGLLLGGTICFLQQEYGLVSMGMETSVLSNYPIKMNPLDFIYTAICLIFITFIISYRPAYIATQYNSVKNI